LSALHLNILSIVHFFLSNIFFIQFKSCWTNQIECTRVEIESSGFFGGNLSFRVISIVREINSHYEYRDTFFLQAERQKCGLEFSCLKVVIASPFEIRSNMLKTQNLARV
jgi:hypothetical protein